MGAGVCGNFSMALKSLRITDIRNRCTCDYRSLRIGLYEKEFDAQDLSGIYTHPSVLAMCSPRNAAPAPPGGKRT